MMVRPVNELIKVPVQLVRTVIKNMTILHVERGKMQVNNGTTLSSYQTVNLVATTFREVILSRVNLTNLKILFILLIMKI